MTDVPASHPRYVSLRLRDAIVAGVAAGITSPHGLIAHGRGEAFDYLIGEATQPFARDAIRAAAAMLLLARHPVLSVNGNAAALVPGELVALGRVTGAPLEVNIFHTSGERERAIARHLEAHGAGPVLRPTREAQLDYIESNRRFVHPEGIYQADVIFVPLEDGDRCQALRRMGREVVTVDLNPLSRTARTASITIVDNVARAMPALIEAVGELAGRPREEARAWLAGYRNEEVLAAAAARIRRGE
ncbi:MAG: 4-phosphopantoate--beta-alanine ligase [Gemmatimonadota bacterium]